jgi:hypothetical protein
VDVGAVELWKCISDCCFIIRFAGGILVRNIGLGGKQSAGITS